ncbi:MAG: hypothetical protein ACREQ9_00670 [Candidatus Binatia bacterium]
MSGLPDYGYRKGSEGGAAVGVVVKNWRQGSAGGIDCEATERP